MMTVTRKVISGFDPLHHAYFLHLMENNREVSNPLLFPFEGEDDSFSAQNQQEKLSVYKDYWVRQGKSVDEIVHIHANDVN